MFPVGKGQRLLICGSRNTGKTRLALNMIRPQKRPNRYYSPEGYGVERTYCIYVSIGCRRTNLVGNKSVFLVHKRQFNAIVSKPLRKTNKRYYIPVRLYSNQPLIKRILAKSLALLNSPRFNKRYPTIAKHLVPKIKAILIKTCRTTTLIIATANQIQLKGIKHTLSTFIFKNYYLIVTVNFNFWIVAFSAYLITKLTLITVAFSLNPS